MVLGSAPSHASAPQPEPANEPLPADESTAGGGLIPVPIGCPAPPAAAVAFVGTVVDKDEFIEKGTVRFEIDQIRAGDATRFAVRGLIDVRYGPDSQYVEIGEQYLVGAAVDPDVGALASKVAPAAPLFGGDAVIGLDDDELDCPELDDPVMTLNVDGTSVDSGVLSPLFEDRRLLFATIGVPAAVAGLALVALILVRRLLGLGLSGVFTLGRRAVTPVPDHRAARVRHHDIVDR